MPDGLQMNEIVAAQQGQTPDQLAATAQSSTLPASIAPNFNSISSTNLQSTPQVTLPTPPPPSGNPNGLVSSVNATQPGLQNYISSLTPAPTAADTQNQSILDSLSSLTGQDTGKSQFQLQQEQANGVPALQKSLTDLNGQITTGSAEYQQLVAQENQNLANLGGNGSVETKAVLAAQHSGVTVAAEAQKASKAADLALLAAKAQATSGNINTALTLAKNATDAKYTPIEDNIKVKQAQLAAIQPMLDKEQKVTALAQQKTLQDQADATAQKKADETNIQQIAMQAAGNGASQGIITAITNATDPKVALALATPYLAKAQTQVVEVNGHSLLIDSQTGKTLQDLGTSNAIIQANIAHSTSVSSSSSTSIIDPATDAGVKAIIAANPNQYGNAANAIDAKYGAGTASLYDSQLQAVYNNKQNVNSVFAGSSIPSIVAPYLNTASTGVQYVDASTLQGTAAQKTQIIQAAQKAGLKIITNKNTAADLVNISDAKAKLDTIGTVFASIAQPNALSRNLYGLGLTKFSTMAQTNTQQAAAGALQSVGLDILKAISGVQGFRGNQSAIQQITDHLPTIYDTKDVVAQKIDYINQLISDRENAALGTSTNQPQSSTSNTSSSAPPTVVPASQIPPGYYQASDGKFYKK
jgi:hypothetical protein